MAEKYYYLEQSPSYKDKYIISLNHEKFLFPNGTYGSYGVFAARIMNLSYAQFLRYCRDMLGADLVGKNHKYVVPYFDDTKEVQQFVKLLNARMAYIMNEHEFPYSYKEKDGEVIREELK